jgi:N-formylmaleamate deformylase
MASVANGAMRAGHLRANGIRIHYLDYAGSPNQPPILIVPGITSPAVTWAFAAEKLAAEKTTGHHRVVVVDLRGRGLSESGPGLGYSLDDYVADISDVIIALELRKPILLGHALGGRIGIRLAGSWPNVLSKLILVDPPLAGPGRRPYEGALDYYLKLIDRASRGAALAEFRKLYPKWSDEQIALRLQWLPSCSVEAVTESHHCFHTEDVFGDIPNILCETLLLRAAKAKVVTLEDEAEILALNPRVRAASVDAGHMVPWENLPDFLAIVRGFIDERAPASAARLKT